MNLEEKIKKEGNYLEWTYKAKWDNYTCMIIRNNLGVLCGYVILTPSNDFFGVDYFDIPVRVHGGLTYSDNYDGVWKIGFDCGHYGDLVPKISELINEDGNVYRDMEFVKKECESLADQISKYSKAKKRYDKINCLKIKS